MWDLRIVLVFFFFFPDVTEKEGPGPSWTGCVWPHSGPPTRPVPEGLPGSWRPCGSPFESHDTALAPTEAQKGGSGEGLILPPPSS